MEAPDVFFYSVIHPICSCRQENGDLKNIGRFYKEYCKRLTNGSSSIDILNEMKLYSTCCRPRFMSIPTIPMIDRSKERIYDDRNNKKLIEDTIPLQPGRPMDFPVLEGIDTATPIQANTVNTRTLEVIPPEVKIEGELPSRF